MEIQIQDIYEKHKQRYGSPRIAEELRKTECWFQTERLQNI
ncbi:MAG: transposase [Bacteroidales bacterium]|nr:transposase [Bacteroidales bacterium]